MKGKKWGLVIAMVVFSAACFFLFFKTFSEKNVAENADHIISLDTKRITNTIIWTYITTPSLWKTGKLFSSKSQVDWKDMVKIPDYVFIFHITGQPPNAWYTVLEVKDEDDFKEGLALYGFVNVTPSNRVVSKKAGLAFVRYQNKLLVGNAGVEDTTLISETAERLFMQNKHIVRENLQQHIDIANHVAWTFSGNDFVKNISGGAGFDKERIHSMVNIILSEPCNMSQSVFSKSIDIPANLAFTQPSAILYKHIPDASRQKASRWLNFNIDSLFLPSNNYYQLLVGKFVNKTDTAVSYEYDADFNPIEKRVVNNVLQPSFELKVNGKNARDIYNYWSNNGIIDKTTEGDLFTSMPFVKSYCSVKEDSLLIIRSNNWNVFSKTALTDSCFLSASINTLMLSDSVMKYLPASLLPLVQKIASINLLAKNAANNGIKVDMVIDKRRDKEWVD